MLNDIKLLYVNGDSCAAGQGLDDQSALYDFSEKKRHSTWGGYLAKKLGVNIIDGYANSALPGGSNRRIFRTSILDISKLLLTRHPNEIFVVLALTDSSRNEWYFTEYGEFCPFLVHCPPGKNSHRALLKMHELYVTYFDNIEENKQRFLSEFLGLQSFLKVNGIRYLITQSLNIFPDVDPAARMSLSKSLEFLAINDSQFDYSKIIDSPHFMEFNAGINGPLSACNHPLEMGHREWAEIVHQRIMKEYD